MTSPQDQDTPAVDVVRETPLGRERLAAAAGQLAGRTTGRALEIAGGVLTHVLAQPHRSMPVRANGVNRDVHVSERVIGAVISRRVDSEVVGTAVGRVVVSSTSAERVTKIVVELIGQYGRDLVDSAHQAQEVVHAVLRDLLGPPEADIQVAFTHLHVTDITIADPTVVAPADE